VQDRNAQQSGESFYIARIAIDMDEFNRIAKSRKLELHPGMQAEVQIVTGERTLLKYLLDPITDTMFRAFKEK
jgi:HlyD family secretion protein